MSSAFWRYTAFQVPGWCIAAGGGWLAHRWLEVPVWLASGVLVVWVVKDYALYPFLRFAYESDHRLPIERMIGHSGTAAEPLSPDGYVRVRGELWRARLAGNDLLDRGERIEVTGIEGTTLLVQRTAPGAGGQPRAG